MKVRLEGNELSIRVPLTEGKASKSGKSIVLASTRGQQVVGKWEGRPITLQLNVMQAVHGGMTGDGSGNLIEIETGRGFKTGALNASRKKSQHRVTSTGRKSSKVAAEVA